MKKYFLAVLLVLSIILSGCNGPDTEGRTYSILYYGNGETGGIAPVDTRLYTSGEDAVVKGKNTLYKDGHEFQNWNTKKQGDGVPYDAGATITVKNFDIFLYAIWKK